MARERLAAHMIKDVLRLHLEEKLGLRAVAAACNVSLGAAAEYCSRARAADLSWPLPAGMDDAALLRLLYPESAQRNAAQHPLPDFELVHHELHRKGVTLQLLWQEYQERNGPASYRYSQFCDLYRDWRRHLRVSMRQVHVAGEKTFVDYAGQTIRYLDEDGREQKGHLFVAVLGASSYTYAEVTATEGMADWIMAHAHAYEYFQGVTQLTISDNPKTAVTEACRYEPDINRTYLEMGQHYGTVILPARPRKPKDKAKVEVGVQVAERWILAVLRHRPLFGLAEVNQAVRPLLTRLNQRVMRGVKKTREQLYLEVDKPALRPLPPAPYEYADLQKATSNIDYHVAVEGNFYSVPHSLCQQPMRVRLAQDTVEIFHNGRRVAAHARAAAETGHVGTIPEHRPKSHQKFLDWPPGRLVAWAAKTGPSCAKVVERIMAEKPHPEAGYRACLGIMRMSKQYGAERMEAACRRALAYGTCSYRSVKSILGSRLDQAPLPEPHAVIPKEPENPTVRGAQYYT